ncbi:MAG: nucleotidyltransferase family protein [Jatrophihabitantaceae bacterium]
MITGLVLAAGAGRRLGRPKAELLLGGRRLLDRAIDTLRAGGCDEVVAVLRAGQQPGSARLVINPDPDEGMGGSLRCGLAALTAESQACVLLLVDLPAVRAGEVAELIQVYRQGASLVAARRAGQRSHPVLIDRRWYPDIVAAAVGDQGGRAFFAGHLDDTAFIDYPDPISDIDTEADLARAERELGAG